MTSRGVQLGGRLALLIGQIALGAVLLANFGTSQVQISTEAQFGVRLSNHCWGGFFFFLFLLCQCLLQTPCVNNRAAKKFEMPSDDYTSVVGGSLKLKGGKIKKHKKKKASDKGGSDLEKALDTGGRRAKSTTPALEAEEETRSPLALSRRDKDDHQEREEEEDDQPPTAYKTEAERRFEEARRKKVRRHLLYDA